MGLTRLLERVGLKERKIDVIFLRVDEQHLEVKRYDGGTSREIPYYTQRTRYDPILGKEITRLEITPVYILISPLFKNRSLRP